MIFGCTEYALKYSYSNAVTAERSSIQIIPAEGSQESSAYDRVNRSRTETPSPLPTLSPDSSLTVLLRAAEGLTSAKAQDRHVSIIEYRAAHALVRVCVME
jgi:hypothetical protein